MLSLQLFGLRRGSVLEVSALKSPNKDLECDWPERWRALFQAPQGAR